MTVSARQYASGAENIAIAYALRQKLMAPPVRKTSDRAVAAPVVKRITQRLPMWQWGEAAFDAHVKAFRHWQIEQGHRCRNYMHERCAELGITFEDLTGPKRTHPLVDHRQLIIWEIKKFVKPTITWPELGRLFGGRDHTTCLWAFRKVDAQQR